MTAPAGPQATQTDDSSYPTFLRALERDAVVTRRIEAGARSDPGSPPEIGLALSGGGIRSATFCLGVLQALARADLLKEVDFMSTVSGGGYIGAFLGGLYSRGREGEAKADARSRRRAQLIGTPEAYDSFEVGWLRANGRYLAPNGAGASWLAGAILLRNWVAVGVVLTSFATTLAFATELLHLGINAFQQRLVTCAPLSEAWTAIADSASPLFVLPIAVILFAAIPLGVGYWFVPVRETGPIRAVALLVGLFSLLGGGWLASHGDRASPSHVAGLGVSISLFLAIVAWGLLGRDLDHDGVARHRFSALLRTALVVALVLSAIALCDAIGAAVYAVLWMHHKPAFLRLVASFYGAASFIVLGGHRILAMLGSKRAPRAKLPLPILTTGVGGALLLLGGALVSVVSHAVVWQGESTATCTCAPVKYALCGLFASAALTVPMGLIFAFVNESSLASFYAARLTRAYLGASNPERVTAATRGRAATEPLPNDQISMAKYRPHENGGPLHLINVTVNETVDPRLEENQPDRHGVPLAIGPCGMSVGVRHHARNEPEKRTSSTEPLRFVNPTGDPKAFAVFPKFVGNTRKREEAATATKTDGKASSIEPENLQLGEWIAISGAAVAPGLGSRTRLGNSLLLTLFNLRLGYWWDSGIEPSSRPGATVPRGARAVLAAFAKVSPVYSGLLSELLGRFPGTASRRWYLSDGGHFDNTACYELLRRKLPVIVLCDAGTDPDYALGDLSNLVRLARLDFGAEITFLDATELADEVDPSLGRYIAPLEELGRVRPMERVPRAEAPHAALARIRYRNGDEGRLLVLKPTLCGGEPLDVRNYGATHPDFPHESTADQFFDDAQWEAYRRLGEHIATCVLGMPSHGPETRRWPPRHLRPLAQDAVAAVAHSTAGDAAAPAPVTPPRVGIFPTTTGNDSLCSRGSVRPRP
jgi:hypothetical protein